MAELAQVTVRAGTPDDADALVALGRVVVPATYAKFSPIESRRLLETWWTDLAVAGSLRTYPHWVVEVDDALVGVANLGTRGDKQVLWKHYVHPHHWGVGLGDRLLDEVYAATADEPLWVPYAVGNTLAATYYEQRGFVEQHRETNPPYPDQVWMRRES
jgi:GNAT superfamily N-acetyltransferase